jgi:hypothetical protein
MLNDLPTLGVGLAYRPGVEALLDAVGLFEVEPDDSPLLRRASPHATWLLRAGGAPHIPAQVRGRGVVRSRGRGAVPAIDADRVRAAALRRSVLTLDAPWVHEDLGGAGPPRSPEGVFLAAERIARLQAELPVPLLYATTPCVLPPAPGEATDGAFFAAVAEAAGCGLLLDLSALQTNERCGRQPALDVVAELPPARIIAIRLSGPGRLLPETLRLARIVVPSLHNLKAIVLDPAASALPAHASAAAGFSPGELLEQLAELEALYDLHSRYADPTRVHSDPWACA